MWLGRCRELRADLTNSCSTFKPAIFCQGCDSSTHLLSAARLCVAHQTSNSMPPFYTIGTQWTCWLGLSWTLAPLWNIFIPFASLTILSNLSWWQPIQSSWALTGFLRYSPLISMWLCFQQDCTRFLSNFISSQCLNLSYFWDGWTSAYCKVKAIWFSADRANTQIWMTISIYEGAFSCTPSTADSSITRIQEMCKCASAADWGGSYSNPVEKMALDGRGSTSCKASIRYKLFVNLAVLLSHYYNQYHAYYNYFSTYSSPYSRYPALGTHKQLYVPYASP